MTTCKEYRDDVMTITAIPVRKISTAVPTSPVLALTPAITYDFSQHFDADTITIGLSSAVSSVGGAASAVGSLIPIVRTTGKVKDEESDSVPGRFHTVTVTCQVDDRDSAVWNNLLTLERTPSYLLLTFRDKTQAFVSATKDTYSCTVNRDGAKTSVQFKIQNLMGIQLVNSPSQSIAQDDYSSSSY